MAPLFIDVNNSVLDSHTSFLSGPLSIATVVASVARHELLDFSQNSQPINTFIGFL